MPESVQPDPVDKLISNINQSTYTVLLNSYLPRLNGVNDSEGRDSGPETQEIGFLIIPNSPAANNDSSAQVMTDSDLQACLEIISETSKDDYKNSSIGWKPSRKKREMKDLDMKYLTIRDGNVINGFASFMFTRDEDLAVLYIYEIHLRSTLRGKGLGKRLMALIEDAARLAGVEKCMLTVFKSNTMAWKWYESMGYGIDETNPGDLVLRGGRVKTSDYLILSKKVESQLELEQSNLYSQLHLDS